MQKEDNIRKKTNATKKSYLLQQQLKTILQQQKQKGKFKMQHQIKKE